MHFNIIKLLKNYLKFEILISINLLQSLKLLNTVKKNFTSHLSFHLNFLFILSLYILSLKSFNIHNMDSAKVFICMVCSRPHPILRIEKKRMLLKYVDGNIDIISHISSYDCLCLASPHHRYSTTHLQYRTLKFLQSISSIITKLMKNHCVSLTSSRHPYISGPLTCHQRSHFFNFLCNHIIRNSYILGEHFLKIDTLDNLWRLEFDSTIKLLNKINRSLWSYALRHHPHKCRDCSPYGPSKH